MKVLVTGGCGFIGSNFVKMLINETTHEVANLDKQTYAGQGRNLEHMRLANHPAYTFVQGDIADSDLVRCVFEEEEPEVVFNFAAESHVDRSIEGSGDFISSNIAGAANIFDACLKYGVETVVQISTDEVYGSIEEGSATEETVLIPSNPYSASKAGADHLALSYFRTHELPVIITRSANNYGPYQFPEKLLPLFITNLMEGKNVPLMFSKEEPALNIRDWIHVEDNCRAILMAYTRGNLGEIYNIPGDNERTNAEMTDFILEEFSFGWDRVDKVPHRKGHDKRYSMDGSKIKALGYEAQRPHLKAEIGELVDWYEENENWWKRLKQ